MAIDAKLLDELKKQMNDPITADLKKLIDKRVFDASYSVYQLADNDQQLAALSIAVLEDAMQASAVLVAKAAGIAEMSVTTLKDGSQSPLGAMVFAKMIIDTRIKQELKRIGHPELKSEV